MPWIGAGKSTTTQGAALQVSTKVDRVTAGPGVAEHTERQLLSTDFPPTLLSWTQAVSPLWERPVASGVQTGTSMLFSAFLLCKLESLALSGLLSSFPLSHTLFLSWLLKINSSSTSNGLWVCLPIDEMKQSCSPPGPESWGILGSHASSQHHPTGSEHLWGLMARAEDMPEMLTLDWCFANGQGANVLVSQLLPERLHKDFYSYFWLLLLYPRVLETSRVTHRGDEGERREEREKGDRKGGNGEKRRTQDKQADVVLCPDSPLRWVTIRVSPSLMHMLMSQMGRPSYRGRCRRQSALRSRLRCPQYKA